MDHGAHKPTWQELLEHTAGFVSGSHASASPHAVLWDVSNTHYSKLVWGRLLQVPLSLQPHPCTSILLVASRWFLCVQQGALWHQDAPCMLMHTFKYSSMIYIRASDRQVQYMCTMKYGYGFRCIFMQCRRWALWG